MKRNKMQYRNMQKYVIAYYDIAFLLSRLPSPCFYFTRNTLPHRQLFLLQRLYRIPLVKINHAVVALNGSPLHPIRIR